jgi:hypothetical protein
LGIELGYKASSVNTLIKGFQKEVGTRYNRYAVLENRYNLFAVIDYLKYRNRLKDETTRKSVPPFDASEVAEMCGAKVGRIS